MATALILVGLAVLLLQSSAVMGQPHNSTLPVNGTIPVNITVSVEAIANPSQPIITVLSRSVIGLLAAFTPTQDTTACSQPGSVSYSLQTSLVGCLNIANNTQTDCMQNVAAGQQSGTAPLVDVLSKTAAAFCYSSAQQQADIASLRIMHTNSSVNDTVQVEVLRLFEHIAGQLVIR